MDKKASITALMSAFARAYHAENCETPVFADTVARQLFSEEEYGQMKNYVKGGIDFFAPERKGSFRTDEEMLGWLVNTQLAPTPLARARYCEDSLKTAVLTGTSQYVILGAGLDTFAWREPGLMETLHVFEVDHPLTQEDKKARLARAGLDTPSRLRFVPVDFARDDLKAKLLEAGFDPRKKTFFSWLGVSYYLSPEQIGRMLDSLSSFAAEGSTLLFDYADEDLFSAGEKRVQNMLAMAAAGGEPMKFCSDELELTVLLEKYHFLIYELLTPEDIQRNYFSAFEDGLSAFEHISYVLAVIKGTPFIGTREKILQAALRLFARDGYEAVSVSAIAGELGITKGALYKHYKNKRDIFDSIVERMEQADYEGAKKYEMPEGPARQMTEVYEGMPLEKILYYTEAQFHRWTQDEFSSNFRKMLTLEQYRSDEMAALYQQYLAGGPLAYMTDLFRGITGSETEAKRLALEFYAPVYFLYSAWDGGGGRAEIQELLREHISGFSAAQRK